MFCSNITSPVYGITGKGSALSTHLLPYLLPSFTPPTFYPVFYPSITSSVYCITGKGSALSTVGVFEANNQSFSPADLALFQVTHSLSLFFPSSNIPSSLTSPLLSYHFPPSPRRTQLLSPLYPPPQSYFSLPNQPVATLVGPRVHGGYQGDSYCRSAAGAARGACSESMLDLEYLMGVAPGRCALPTPLTLLSIITHPPVNQTTRPPINTPCPS